MTTCTRLRAAWAAWATWACKARGRMALARPLPNRSSNEEPREETPGVFSLNATPARLGPCEALQQLLQDDPGDDDRVAADERGPQRCKPATYGRLS
jgi:hypothetical protein